MWVWVWVSLHLVFESVIWLIFVSLQNSQKMFVFIEIVHLIESASIVHLIFRLLKKIYTHIFKMVPVVFLIDISNTPQQHIHTRLRSHFNQMWHILALTLYSIFVYIVAPSLSGNTHIHIIYIYIYILPVSIELLLFIRWKYFMKFLTHIYKPSSKFESAILIYMISFTCACHASWRREWTKC